ALSFDYGQRHRCELDAAARIAQALGAHEHIVVKLDLSAIGGSALTDPAIDVPKDRSAEAIAGKRPRPLGGSDHDGPPTAPVALGPSYGAASGEPGDTPGAIPLTYVPGRNMVFLA